MNSLLYQQLLSKFDKNLVIKDIKKFDNGLYNDTLSVNTLNHKAQKKYILRIAPDDQVPKLFYEIDMMRCEPSIHQLVREKTNVPVPEILYHDFTRNIIRTDYLIMEYIQGENASYSDVELGKLVRELHSITSDSFGYPYRNLDYKTTWKETFYIYVQKIFEDCLSVNAISEKEHRFFMDVYEKNIDYIEECTPTFLHLDLWRSNILTHKGTIVAILDFDRSMFGHTELEFAVLDSYGYCTPGFFKGYGKKRPWDHKAQIRQKLYIVYELIKYAFIRLARGHSESVSRNHVYECELILKSIS